MLIYTTRPSGTFSLSLPLYLVALLLLACLSLGNGAKAQGDYVNFEIPTVKPMDLATVAGRDYLLVCNTPDNAVEIYDTTDNSLLQRVEVGLAPVTVKYNPILGRFFTCNYLGDSVSKVRFMDDGGLQAPHAVMERTAYVGDEPCDIAWNSDQSSFLVTLASRSAVAWVETATLIHMGPDFGRRINLTIPLFDPVAPHGLKEPRRMVSYNNRFYMLNHRGGNSANYDFDIFGIDLPSQTQVKIGGLGSINGGMEWGFDDRLYVVGTMARNELLGEAAVAAAPTGFTQSHVYRVSNMLTGNPTVDDRNINLDPITGNPVGPGQALSQPTDVELMHVGIEVRKIFFTAFQSDRVGILRPDNGPASQWQMSRIDIPTLSASQPLAGPRGLCFKPPNGLPNDPGFRLYCLNGLSNSITVIDPINEVVLDNFPLQNDPTPAYIRQGQEFLYSAKLSGNGFTACASCHVDGRTDGIAWDLGDKSATQGAPIPPLLVDGIAFVENPPTEFPPDKGLLVTQSLQGLVNHHVESTGQDLLTNAPYHWRGDRATFLDFNGAFVNLMGAPDIGNDPNDPKGLTAVEMRQFERMINSVAYPPNPDQNLDRRFDGDFGAANAEDGIGSLRGIKLFHTRPFPTGVFAGRSCVQCHSLPEGSNNRLTLETSFGSPGSQPLETAASRGIRQREGMLETSHFSLSLTRISEAGLLHSGHELASSDTPPAGVALSINWFLFIVFGPAFSGADIYKLVDLIAAMQQFDSGIAPVVGAVHSLSALDDFSTSGTNAFLNLVESESRKAHAGLVAYFRDGVAESSYYYDVTVTPPVYRQVIGSTGMVFTRPNLLAKVIAGDDVLIFQAVPVGSERRIAGINNTGVVPLPGLAPSNLGLLPMRAATQWEDVPLITKNWLPGTGPNDFNWDGQTPSGSPIPTPLSQQTIRIYQHALKDLVPQLGLDQLRHEAPRRFRVAGNDIRHGSRLRIWMPDLDVSTGNPTIDIAKSRELTMNLFPTDKVLLDGRRVWETTVETDPMFTYQMMLGGLNAPGVQEALQGLLTEPPAPGDFNPLTWNSYKVAVLNKDGTFAYTVGNQRVTIQ